MSVDFEDYLDVEVFDHEGRLLGSLNCFWDDDDGKSQLLGIKLRTRPDGTCAIPVDLCTADERRSCILIGARGDRIATAPMLDCDEELDSAFEMKVYRHFELSPPDKPRHLTITRSN